MVMCRVMGMIWIEGDGYDDVEGMKALRIRVW